MTYSAQFQNQDSINLTTSTTSSQIHVHTQQTNVENTAYFVATEVAAYSAYERSRLTDNVCLFCEQIEYRKFECENLNKLRFEKKIYLNDRNRICYDKAKHNDVKMRLFIDLTQFEDVRKCLRKQKAQNVQNITQIRIIKVKELSLSKKKEDVDNDQKNMIVKIKTTRQINDFKTRNAF